MNRERLGERLKAYRKKQGLSQEKVAKIIHESRQAVSQHENSRATPPVEILRAYANLYNISYESLIAGTELDNTQYDSEEARKKAETELQFMGDIRFLPDSFQSLLFDSVHSFRELYEKELHQKQDK